MTALTRHQEHLLDKQAELMYSVYWSSLGVHAVPFALALPNVQQAWRDVARMVVGQIGQASRGKR